MNNDYQDKLQQMAKAFEIAARKVPKEEKKETNMEMYHRIKKHKEKVSVKKAKAVVRKEIKAKRQHKIQTFFKKIKK